jgi:hypothetical protein
MGFAKNLDLSTLPQRESVELTIYNSEDLTLVRERRTLGFRKGVNPLQFSWSGTLIDPTSVELSFGEAEGKLRLLDTTFPHNKPQMLYWNVEADEAVTARIEISYFTSGIHWSADYVAIADQPEQQLDLDGFVKIDNRSGEEYRQARVRLVVGQINLVEKIAEMASIAPGEVDALKEGEYRQLRHRAARKAMAPAPMAMMEMALADEAVGYGMAQSQPKEVAKEGLGEYFIYTIEGRETIPDGWSKRLRSFSAKAAPMETVYRYRRAQYGDRLVRLYLLDNDKESNLGETPIPNGRVSILRRDGAGGLDYLAEQQIKYVPIGDELELQLGENPEVIFELVPKRVYRDNIWMRMHKPSVYKRVDDGHIQVDHRARVEGWDEHTLYEQRIRNYSDKPIQVEVRRAFDGDVTFKSAFDADRHDYRTVEFEAEVGAGERAALGYEVIIANGYNAKQTRVEIVQ